MKVNVVIKKNNSKTVYSAGSCPSVLCPEKYQYCPDPRKPKYTPAVVNPGKDK